MMRIAILILIASLVGVLLHSPSQHDLIALSRVSNGNLARLQRVIAKARRGEPVTIGFIGGSITAGQAATTPDQRYANRVTDWWIEHFPRSKITMVNAGVRGTGSNYGCLRVSRDLLSFCPDFVVVEFGVNDKGDIPHAETYEGVIRQLIADPGNPAVVLLFMMHSNGTNAQGHEIEIGRNYELPMISFRDAVWPEMTAGRMKHSDLFADSVHPNDAGHAAIASFINSLLRDALSLPAVVPDDVLPPPRFTDLFTRTKLIEAADLKPVSINGWKYDGDKHCWISADPGSVIEFQMPGRLINLLYGQVSTNGGTVSVTIDDKPAVICDAWFDGTWAGHCQTDVMGRDLSPGMHHVRIQLIDEVNILSTGHEFQIWGLGSAGN